MIHLERFVDRLRGQEARGARDFVMSIADAKDLHADITRLLLLVETLRGQVNVNQNQPVITVEVDGGQF